MSDEQAGWNGGQRAFGDVAPALVHYTDRVLFDEAWERPETFYAGWPKAMSAMRIAKELFDVPDVP